MDPETLFDVVIGFNWSIYLWEVFLKLRQIYNLTELERRPREIDEFISDENYQLTKQKSYYQMKFYMIYEFFWLSLITVILYYGFLSELWYSSRENFVHTVVFLLTISLTVHFIDLPWKIYQINAIEHASSELNAKIATNQFFKEKILFLILLPLILIPIVWIFNWIDYHDSKYLILSIWLVHFLWSLAKEYRIFYSSGVELPDGELRDKINDLTFAIHFKNQGIYVFDSNCWTQYSNRAFLAGYGDRKCIYMSDTLLNEDDRSFILRQLYPLKVRERKGSTTSITTVASDVKIMQNGHTKDDKNTLSIDEVAALVAYQLGHWANMSIIKQVMLNETLWLIGLIIVVFLCDWIPFYEAFEFRKEAPLIIGFSLAMILVSTPFNKLTTNISNVFKRKCDSDVDKLISELGFYEFYLSALKKTEKNFLNLLHDDWVYALFTRPYLTIVEKTIQYKKRL